MQYGKKTLAATIGSLFLGAAPASWAALNAVDTPPPYLAANGFFPAWYQDTNGLGLDLCLSTAVSPNPAAAGGPMCVLVPNPGIYDPAFATCFPGQCVGVALPPEQTYNFPDESFYATADAAMDAANFNGVVLTYVSAVEAAFGTGLPTAGDQITFARIRVRVTLPADSPVGTYTITHPFGVETANVANAGVKVINLTRDIGVAPGIFSGALAGDIGPFLRGVGGPYTVSGETFIGDPNIAEPVTGSPFGTNFVRIEGPAPFAAQQQNLFAVSGKVHAGALATPLLIERTSYSRTAATAQQDIFVKAPPPPDYAVHATDANGGDTPMTDGAPAFSPPLPSNGAWFGQSANDPTLVADVPTVSVTAESLVGPGTPTSHISPVVDLVTIRNAQATCLPAPATNCTLTVEAASSDEREPPVLSVNGSAMAPGAGTAQTITFTGLAIPPATVTVNSARGGSDTESVTVLPAPEAPAP